MHESRLNAPFPDSKCHACSGVRRVNGKRADYLMCTRRTAKYRAQPVRVCPDFEAKPSGHAR